MILYGKKTILHTFTPIDFDFVYDLIRQTNEADFNIFAGLSKEEIYDIIVNGINEGSIAVFIAFTVEGKASKKFAVIFAFQTNIHEVSFHGIVDKRFLKGLAKRLRGKKVTYTEDAGKTALEFLKKHFDRIETLVNKENRLSVALVKKLGFKKEGLLRKKALINGKYIDYIIFSIVKED